MNEREALIMLKENCPPECFFGQLREAVEVAISALEKQIQKKPKMLLDAYWVCPTCGNKVDHPFRHCTRCGQAIKWEDKE